ncbi:MAG: 30S ribosomal protein S2 [Patescibacteria group bacterium]
MENATEKKTMVSLPTVKELLEAGVHFGHQATRWNPKMKLYIFQKKNGIHIIDLMRTHQLMLKACQVVSEISKRNGKILFVGTKKQAWQIVKSYAQSVNMPYISNRWIGGLLTNYKVVSHNINRLNSLTKDLANNDFLAKYTKKEIQAFKEEQKNLLNIYEGVQNLNRLPDAVFVIDSHNEKTAVAEAVRKKIPVIAIMDTNADPDLIDYPIPANDDSYKSLDLLIKTIAANIGAPKSN